MFPAEPSPRGRCWSRRSSRRHPAGADVPQHPPLADDAERREPRRVRLRVLAAARPDSGRLRPARRGRLGDSRCVHRDRRLGGGDVGRRGRQAVAAAEVAGRDRITADGYADRRRLVPVVLPARHVQLCLRHRLQPARDVLVPGRAALGGAVGTRAAGRLGRVPRSDAVLRLRAAEPDGAADRPARIQRSQTLVAIAAVRR